MFYFVDVFESVFNTGDVLGNSIFTCDVFESRLLSDVNSLPAIRVPAGTKNSHPVGFLW